MLSPVNTPTRVRTIQEDIYVANGQDGQFTIDQPFTAEMLQSVEKIGASPEGVANQLNQVLCENLVNLLAARARNAAKNGVSLPTQEDMDALYASYNFSGNRTRGPSNAASLFTKVFNRLAGQFIKRLIKTKGYKDLSAPVTVAKPDMEPTANQISYEDFEDEVAQLVAGEGPWGEVDSFISVREGLIDDAKIEEAAVKARALSAENMLNALNMRV